MADTDKHNLRIDDLLWRAAGAKAERLGFNVTAYVRQSLFDLIEEGDEDTLRRLGLPAEPIQGTRMETALMLANRHKAKVAALAEEGGSS